jgi:tRNA-specific adenosine deaminase 2
MMETQIPSVFSENPKHAHWMKEALKMVSCPLSFSVDQVRKTDGYTQGETALQHGETPVGCVLVYNDQVVGRGMNDTNRSMNVSDHLPSD